MPGAATSRLKSATDAIRAEREAFRAKAKAMAGKTPVQPLAFNDQLAAAATKHNAAMIAADTQSHQVSGEAGLGSRISAEGYATAPEFLPERDPHGV